LSPSFPGLPAQNKADKTSDYADDEYYNADDEYADEADEQGPILRSSISVE
jgi:hypothetical protein